MKTFTIIFILFLHFTAKASSEAKSLFEKAKVPESLENSALTREFTAFCTIEKNKPECGKMADYFQAKDF